MEDLIEIGKNSLDPLYFGPVDIDRDVSYSYTSGTTGKPKCIVYKELSANALIEMHTGMILFKNIFQHRNYMCMNKRRKIII